MEADTVDNNALQPNTGRNQLGRFTNGNPNPKRGYQKHADRAQYLREKYTREDVLELIRDEVRLNKLPVIDAAIIRQLAMTVQPLAEVSNTDVRMEREALIDRIEGKSSETVEVNHKGAIGVITADLSATLLFLAAGGMQEEPASEGTFQEPVPA